MHGRTICGSETLYFRFEIRVLRREQNKALILRLPLSRPVESVGSKIFNALGNILRWRIPSGGR